jgi:hypothetical protein
MKHLGILAFVLISFSLFAQNSKPKHSEYFSNSNKYIKVSLTDYFSFEPVYGLSYSYPIEDDFAQMQFGLGYVTYNRSYRLLSWEDDPIQYNGFKAYTQYRHYYLTKGKERAINKGYIPSMRSYVAFEMSYKYGNIWHEDNIDRFDGAFVERMSIVSHKHVVSGLLLLGGESEIVYNSTAIIDWYLGIGIRYKNIHSKIPYLNTRDYSPFFYDEEQIPVLITGTLGLRIGLVWR